MKCPKCGYVSFDHLQSCKKCGDDLTVHKARYKVGIFAAPKASPQTVGQAPEMPPPPPASVASSGTPEFSFVTADSAAAFPGAGDLSGSIRAPKPAATIATQDTFLEESPADALLAALADAFPPEGEASADPASEFSFDAPFPPPTPELAATGEFLFAASPADAASPGETLEFAFERQQKLQFSLTEGGAAEEAVGEERGAERGEVPAAPERPSLFDFSARQADARTPGAPQAEKEPSAGLGEKERRPVASDDFDRIASSLGELPSPPADSTRVAGEEAGAPAEISPAFEEDAGGDWPLPGESAAGTWPESPGEVNSVAAFSFSRRENATPLWRRLAASLSDGAILGMVFFLFLLAAEAAIGGTRPIAESVLELAVPYFLVFFSLSFGYFTLFHYLMGQTLGKILFRLQVAGSEGESLLLSQAFLRSAGGLLSLLPAGLGFWVIPFDPQGRGWNDRLAGTRVIPVGARITPDRPSAEMESEEPLAAEGMGKED